MQRSHGLYPQVSNTNYDFPQIAPNLYLNYSAESEADVTNWLLEQFRRHYDDNKAPITFNINSAWFALNEVHEGGFVAFLDALQEFDDVFVVSHKTVQDWSLNPVPLSQFSAPTYDRSASCNPQVCELLKGDEYRYMKSCVTCPEVYPWLGNPLGD